MFWERNRTVPKKPTILFCLVHQELFEHFSTIPIISEDFQRLLKIPEDFKRPEDYRNCPYTAEDIRRPEYCCALVEIRDYSPPLSTRSEFRSDCSFRFSKSRKELAKYGVTVLVSALRGHDFKFFVLFAREMFET